MLLSQFLVVQTALIAAGPIGEIIHVPADSPTIQACINAAVSGQDECVVAPGTYNELINFLGKGIALRSSGGPDVTTIDGTGLGGSVVTCISGEGPETVLDGFTITGGSGTLHAGTVDGGGIFVLSSSPTIMHNTISGNNAKYAGGGLFIGNSEAMVAQNSVYGNRSTSGGGLYIGGSSATITNNSISGNAAEDGGGLTVVYSSDRITNNTIRGNTATYYGGGLVVSSHSSPTIAANIVLLNSSDSGAGVVVFSSAVIANNIIAQNNGPGVRLGGASVLTNNTIVGNGIGVLLETSGQTITNNIIAFNTSGILQWSGTGTQTVRYNCVYSNGYNYYGFTGPTESDGNVSVDPRLGNVRYGNLHLQPDSPCVDAGSQLYAYEDEDIDGEGRIHPAEGRVDIGADETDGTVWPSGPHAIVRVGPSGDDDNDGVTWASAKRSVQAGIVAVAAMGGDVWVQSGVYTERINLHPYTYVYGGFAGSETSLQGRDPRTHPTTLDGSRQGSVVTAMAGFRVSTLDGFVVTNGSGTDAAGGSLGGGVFLLHSSPTIVNSWIRNNNADRGGGLFLSHSRAALANNRITANTAQNSGGGLCLESSSPRIIDSAIVGNSAELGGGLYLDSSSPAILGNTLTSNLATSGGGALHMDFSTPWIIHNVLAFNSSGIFHNGGYMTVCQNCAYANGGDDFLGLQEPTETCNIRSDPKFERLSSDGADGWGDDPDTPDLDEGANDDYGDLRLRRGSPCINAGDPSFVPTDGQTDLDGHARVLCGRVDLGAYEFDCCFGDVDCDQVVDLTDFAAWESCMLGPNDTPPGNGCEAFDGSLDLDVDLLDFATFQNTLTAP